MKTTVLSCAAGLALAAAASAAPIQVGFLWHMHQPRYIPDMGPIQADPFFSFSVPDIHNQRFGPYTTWPADAINAGAGMAHLGAHVSFSGSLMENLDELEAAGTNGGMWNNWNATYASEQSFSPSSNYTALGNPRLEMIAFGYFHPLMPLIDTKSIELQIALHQRARAQTFGAAADSVGLFPPETAFSERMIPALAAEGIDWVLVDNFHFDRACENYPHTDSSGVYRPNRADQTNPDPASAGGRWVQLQNLWAPSQVSVPFGYQPHYAQHVDPETGAITRVVAVPAARYEGNEDGRGGYGAFLYDQVMDTYLPDNTDPNHPMFVVLHHDGDNYGGGSDAYYHSNFQNMVSWASSDPDYDVTTVDDYLDRFPPAANDVIHVEDGSWAGADAGDPEFKKWLGGDVTAGATSPDINSWAALTAARAALAQLEQFGAVNPASTADLNAILAGTGTPVQRAWRWMLVSQASDYWYWDGTEVWDSDVTRAANEITTIVQGALPGPFADTTAPTVFVPQREPYNPGGTEFGSTLQPSDFEVWTLANDWSGLSNVTLKWRVDADGVNPIASIQNETYAGGPEVGAWQSVAMTSANVPTPAGVTGAARKAQRYGATISGQNNVLIDYYVEATDTHANTSKSEIMHVWVGQSSSTGGGDTVTLTPDPAIAGQSVTIEYDESGRPIAGAASVYLHYGFDNWSTVVSPDPAMVDPENDGVWTITVPVPASATALDLVFNDGNNNWDNNTGADWHFTVTGADPNAGFEIDGSLDAEAQLIASNGGVNLWAALDADTLYLAATPAGAGNDRFIVLAQAPGAMQNAMWAKSGQVATWDAFVGNEESNGYNAWFDATGATQVAQGSVLECTIDLAGEFGSVPDSVFAAVLSYTTPDGGALVPSLQVPASTDGDGNAEPAEFIEIPLCSLMPAGCCPVDLDGNGALNLDDINAFAQAFVAGDLLADLDTNGVLNLDDINVFATLFVSGCP